MQTNYHLGRECLMHWEAVGSKLESTAYTGKIKWTNWFFCSSCWTKMHRVCSKDKLIVDHQTCVEIEK